MAYELPPLPYDYSALEPFIDEQTMRLHHDIHHKGYVTGLNTALDKLAQSRESGDFGLVQHYERLVAFHGAGHFNHVVFWENMAPAGSGGGGSPTSDLATQIDKDFGSFEKFKAQFGAAAKAVEGSGWGILAWNSAAGALFTFGAMNHQNQTVPGSVPVLMCDVWEHAYYLKYQNKRADYVDNWWNIVNWEDAGKRFEAAPKA
ncbi:MAG: superoxide dismutase [Gemmatimonadaceae bacterium]|nr:superoxide dismutase [Gloeobacterales cyanobacterium ES-bin-141]